MTDQELVELAFTMLERSYVPYSHFPVGAALECADGTVFTGCNVENAAFGSTICAERTALVKAVSEGHRDDFTRIAVVGNSTEPCWPCGACRQMLYEFAPQLELLVARGEEEQVSTRLTLAGDVEAPVEQGQVLGSLKVYVGEELRDTIPIVAAQGVARLTVPGIFSQMLQQLLKAR